MKRRTAVKGLSALAVGMALFPGCSDGLRIDIKHEGAFIFDKNQTKWIEAISDAILPKKDQEFTTYETFPKFVSKMICFSHSTLQQQHFINGYNLCTEEVKSLFKSSALEITPEEIVTYFSDQLHSSSKDSTETEVNVEENRKNKKYFCQNIRDLAIRHLTTSKEYQEKVFEYKLVPGPQYSCS